MLFFTSVHYVQVDDVLIETDIELKGTSRQKSGNTTQPSQALKEFGFQRRSWWFLEIHDDVKLCSSPGLKLAFSNLLFKNVQPYDVDAMSAF